MTAKEVRDLGFISWRDPDAWMEAMRGTKWDNLVAEENQRLKETIKAITTPEQIEKFKQELSQAQKYFELECFTSGPIKITPLSAFSLRWRWDGDSETRLQEARDIYSDNKLVVYTHDIGSGAEEFELVVMDAKTREVLWKRSPVGPTISLDNEKLYYLGVKQKLWYNKVYMCDARTGHSIKMIYEEKDGHYNLSLLRQTYIVRENSGKTDTFYVENGILHPLQPGTEKQIPYRSFKAYYRKEGTDIYYNNNNEALVDTPYDANDIYVSIRNKGEIAIYNHYGIKENYIKQGSVTLDTYGRSFKVRIDDGTQPPYLLEFGSKIKTGLEGPTFKLKTKKFQGISSDGVTVNGVILYKSLFTKPKALLVVGYGAYGIASSPAGCYAKWAPLIERGWGIVYTYIRGGGDDTDSWAQAGRLSGRVHTRDDFLALVESAQKTFKIPAEKTVIYGRSAGGFLMGMCINKESTGRLFKSVYTEVPYVDILRTTTNPDLPLTKMEYNEFGDPAHRPEDFKYLVDLSPADVAITTEAPRIFVLARTGLNDSQVYAYEPIKWIRRLRKPGDMVYAQKVIGIAAGEGHFYSPGVALQAKAEDLAILHYRIFQDPA
jgi:protease II